jgi:two-component system cell cycle response regulator
MSTQSNEKPEILVIDDSKVIRSAAVKMLGDEYVVHQANDGKAGWEVLQENSAISVVFTDMQMPEMSGLELLAAIRGSDDGHIANIPVIMITGQGDSEETKKEVFDQGATDFIGKPFGSIDLLSRARAYAQLNRKVEELEQQSVHDKTTGLFNVSSLEEQGDKTISFALRHRLSISMVQLEIDDFHELLVNHGKAVAQQIIIAVAKRISGALRTEDVAARMGAAKFAVLLPLTNYTHAMIAVERIRDSVNQLVFDTGKEKLRVVLAAGLTSPDVDDNLKFEDMMKQAEIALKRASEKAGDKISSYVENTNEVIQLEAAASDDDLKQAFEFLLEGNYFKIERDHLDFMKERLMPFIEYMENLEDELLPDDGSPD